MLPITEAKIRAWANSLGTPDLNLADVDYRLVSILQAVYLDNDLRNNLLMKGGTALNKLYLGGTSRLSVDLDFNHVGKKETVLAERKHIGERLVSLLEKLDNSYVLSARQNYSQTTVRAGFRSVVGSQQRVKLEISHIERFPILPSTFLSAQGVGGAINVGTYSLEELTATKLRALFERFSGRDIYDLYFVSKLNPERTLVRKLFLYYFYRSRKVYNRTQHFRALRERLEQQKYVDDVTNFVRPRTAFSLKDAAVSILSEYSFLNELDLNDEAFLSLARILLGKGEISKEMRQRVSKVKYPLADLFLGHAITEAAAKATVQDIKLFQRS